MGKTDPEAPRTASRVDGPRPARHAGRHGRAQPAGVRLPRTRRATARSRFEDVRVPAENLIAGEGDGLPDRPGPARPRPHPPLHALDRRRRARARAAVRARAERVTFGKPVAERANIRDWIAESRIEIEMVRLLTLKTAWLMDTVGNKQRAHRDRGDQGRGARRRAAGHRPRDPGARRRRRLRRLPAGADVRAPAHAAARRRPRRGPQDDRSRGRSSASTAGLSRLSGTPQGRFRRR